MRRSRLTRLSMVVLVIAALSAAAACGTAAPGPSPAPSTTSAGTATTSPPAPTATPTATTSTWSSEPRTVTKNIPVPPVPRLIGIRSAAHPQEGYDRITFDFAATLPGYSVRYVDKVIADGSGAPVAVPGRRFLQIVFRPAQAHDDSGTPVMPRAATLSYPMMRAYAITGDYEGVLTVTLGLDDVVGYRVGELPGTPGRIYVDVAA